MTIRTIVALVMSVVCGTSAAVGVNVLMDRNASKPQEVKTASLIVAAVDVSRGTKLKPEFLKTQAWPEGLVPAGAIQDMEEVDDRTTLTQLVAGEVLLEPMLSSSGIVGVAALVRPGMRAYTIATASASAGVAGMVQPGHRVDVLLTVKKTDQSIAGGGGTWTLLQNVEVLAADQRLDQDDERTTGKLSSVTLHVTPEMATKLQLAQTAGTLNLTLRNDADKSISDINPTTMSDLQFLQEYLAEPPAEEIEEPPAAEPMMLAADTSQAPRDILTLRGNSASLVRVSASATSTKYLGKRLPADAEE